jgi:hypothetical protein
MSVGAAQNPGLKSVLAQLRNSPSVDAGGVTRALDTALKDGAISATERRALTQLLTQSSFSSEPVRARLDALLALPDAGLAALAHQLTRKDGVIDLKDTQKLMAVAQGTQQGVVSLRALHVGSKLTTPAAAEKMDTALRSQKRLDQQPLRTHELSRGRTADVVSRRTLSPLGAPTTMAPVKDVHAKALDGALEKAATQRLTLLKSGAPLPATARVVPEDGSARVKAFHMGFGLGADQAGMRFPLQMAQLGKMEGFSVVLRVPDAEAKSIREQLKKEGLSNIQVMGVAGQGDFWSEDQGEMDVNGNVRVPAPAGDVEALQEAAFRDRIARAYPDKAAAAAKVPWAKLREDLYKTYPDASYSMVGAVAERKSHDVVAAIALGKGTTLKANLTHLEGGNVLSGTRPDGQGYSMVGRDSLVQSRLILEKDLGRKVSDAELRAAVAHDLGILPQNVVPVEQPRDFHLDMHMVPIKPGEVLLNDPVEATRLACAWELEDKEAMAPKPLPPNASKEARETHAYEVNFQKELIQDVKERHKEAMAQAQKQAVALTRVAADLEAGGLKVHRAPGVFGVGHTMSENFINAEQGTNPRGERFYIALGGDPRAERVFLAALDKLDTGIARVHLLDREYTQTTLSAGGGISCRCKAEGTLST